MKHDKKKQHFKDSLGTNVHLHNLVVKLSAQLG
jgi:hypothetical protein